MALDLKNDKVFSMAIDGLPRIVELITTAPETKRSLALGAAQQSYFQTAQTLGYKQSDARHWASAVMLQLAIIFQLGERATGVSGGDVSQINEMLGNLLA